MLGTLMFSSQAAHADDGDYDLYLVSLEGAYTRLDIANLRSLSFSQEYVDKVWLNSMSVNRVDGTSVNYVLNTADCLLFAPLATDIDNVQQQPASDALAVKVSPSVISLSTSGMLSVYGLDGRLVRNVSVSAGIPVSTSDMMPGTYILRINGQTAKILIR